MRRNRELHTTTTPVWRSAGRHQYNSGRNQHNSWRCNEENCQNCHQGQFNDAWIPLLPTNTTHSQPKKLPQPGNPIFFPQMRGGQPQDLQKVLPTAAFVKLACERWSIPETQLRSFTCTHKENFATQCPRWAYLQAAVAFMLLIASDHTFSHAPTFYSTC